MHHAKLISRFSLKLFVYKNHMTNLRPAKIDDIEQIQQIEKEYYEVFSCPREILKNWIEYLPENFIVADKNGKIAGFIFFETINKVKAIPFIHKVENKKKGKFIYISEVGILGRNTNILQKLLDTVIKKSKKDECKKIIWLTGQKNNHDVIEINLLLKNGFKKVKNVKKWEAYPNHFVSDHWIWEKPIL